MKMTIIIAIFLSSLIALNTSAIEGTYELIVKKKQEQKRKSRWTLLDWMATKRRMDLMDQWLLLNTEDNYVEVYLDAGLSSVDDESSSPYYLENSFQRYKFGAFVLPFGVEYQSSNLGEGSNIEYLASLRLLGSSLQTTNLIVSYGRNVRENAVDGDLKNDFYQVRSNFYLADFLGVSGSFRKLIDNNNEAGTFEVGGTKVAYQVFVELELLRFYFESFTETNDLKLLSDGSESERENKGTLFGIRVFL